MTRTGHGNARRAATGAAILLLCLSPGAPAEAKQKQPSGRAIECSSKHGDYRWCPTYTIGSVRLVRQLSEARCRLYDTWGVDGDGSGVWVRDGCRALFVVERGGGRRPVPPSGPRSVTCKSDDFSYRECPVATWGRRIFVQKQLSRTRCVRGDNWGLRYTGIWVDRGCAAVFGVD